MHSLDMLFIISLIKDVCVKRNVREMGVGDQLRPG